MSWLGTALPAVEGEDAAAAAIRLEIEKQQAAAAEILLLKQKKKEAAQLQRQRKRKEQQAIRQEQQQQQQGEQQVPKPRKPRKNSRQGQGPSPSSHSSEAYHPGIYMSSTPILSPSISTHTPAEDFLYGGGADSSDNGDILKVEKKMSDALLSRKAQLEELSRFQSEYASDEDAIESDYYEPLAHSEYFSQEEVIRLYSLKLKHLKSMYTHQSSFLQMAYKEKKRLYLAGLEDLHNTGVSYSTDPKILVEGKAGKARITPDYICQQKVEAKKVKLLRKCTGVTGSRAGVRMQAKQLYDEIKAKEKLEGERRRKTSRSTSKCRKRKKTQGHGGKGGHDDEEEDEDKSEEEEEEDEESDASSQDGNECENLFKLFTVARESPTKSVVAATNSKTTCSFKSDYGEKCQQPCLPLTPYCYTHILKDESQTLFKACGRPLGTAEDKCQTPVLEIIEKLGCPTHRIPFVKEEVEPMSKKKERLRRAANLPLATAEEEVDILEKMIAEEVYDMAHFEDALKHVEAKGLRSLDTDDSDEEEELEMPQLPLTALMDPTEIKIEAQDELALLPTCI